MKESGAFCKKTILPTFKMKIINTFFTYVCMFAHTEEMIF